MASLLRTLTDRFTPNASSTDLTATERRKDGFLTAKGTDALFQRTKAEIDGDDCLHDCASCSVKYPRKFEIDETEELYGHVKGWSTHLIVATGKTDWVRDVADEKGSIMEAVDRGDAKPSNGVSGRHCLVARLAAISSVIADCA